jgi:DNA polymerase III subunit delta
VKLPPARIAAFLAKPDATIRAALIYGPDAGLVRERADRLARAICSDLKDPFRIADFTASALAEDPARLNDEAAALSLVGGRRVVRIRDATDTIGALCARFLDSLPPGDSVVVVEAGELAARSSLRRAFEAAPMGVAIPCYADSRRDLEELAREVLGADAISVTGEAMSYLTSHLGGDRLASRRELEKLALFAGPRGQVGLAEAVASVGDNAALTIDDIIFAVAEGDAAGLERSLLRAFSEGEMPITVLRAAMRHFQRLHLVASQIAAGMSEDEALKTLRPPLFFKVQERFKRQMRLWTAQHAAKALERLTRAELNAKRSALPAETICRDALLQIARHAMKSAQ